MPETRQDHPPVPRLVVRVGVTGHRKGPDLAGEELKAAVRQILLEIKTVSENLLQRSTGIYAGDKPVLRVISPLAEGADRLVAQEAIDLGYELQAPLPFLQAEYEIALQQEEGREETVPQFRELLKQATAVLELDGSLASDKEAYEAVGRLVLRQCDILIAVWDNEPAKGIGGTGQIVEFARSIEIPTIRIDPKLPHAMELLSPGAAPESIDSIGKLLAHLFIPPAKEAEGLRHFLHEERPSSWSRSGEIPAAVRPAADGMFRAAFEWADNLANRYASIYRRTYRATYLLGACAVLLAYLGSITHGLGQALLLALELATIVTILGLTSVGRRRCWHERWLDDRHLAENLRITRLLAPFGRVTVTFQVPAHLERGDPRKTWFHWYFRTLVREAGMVAAKMTPEHRRNLREIFSDAIALQVQYHAGRVEASRHQRHRWHQVAQGSFYVAGLACVLHFFPFSHGEPLRTFLNLMVIVFPAFGGAIGAILHQSELERIVRRSEALEERLRSLQEELESLGETPNARDLGRLTEGFSRIYVAELMDWRFLFLDRPLTLPG